SRPITCTGSLLGALHSRPLRPMRPPAPIRSMDSSWEVSGARRNSSARARSYMGGSARIRGDSGKQGAIIAAATSLRRGNGVIRSPFGPSAQLAQLHQLPRRAELQLEHAMNAVVAQERTQMMGRQTDLAAVTA